MHSSQKSACDGFGNGTHLSQLKGCVRLKPKKYRHKKAVYPSINAENCLICSPASHAGTTIMMVVDLDFKILQTSYARDRRDGERALARVLHFRSDNIFSFSVPVWA